MSIRVCSFVVVGIFHLFIFTLVATSIGFTFIVHFFTHSL